jgi:hypothetical protein
VEGDARSFRVALVTSELVNSPDDALDALAVLGEADWGVIQMPASDYPDEVAAALLAQVAEQAEEFDRHGYRLAVVGTRDGLAEALASRGVAAPPQIEPTSAAQLREFLTAAAD